MKIRDLLKFLLGVLLLVIAIRFIVTLASASGFSMPNPIVWLDDAATNLGRAAADADANADTNADANANADASNNVRAADASQDDNVAPAEGSDVLVTKAEVVEILKEIDSLQNISREGLAHTTFRYEVVSGDEAGSSLMATDSGVITGLRISCDDICEQIVLVRGNSYVDLTDEFQVFVPEAAESKYYTATGFLPFSAVTDWSFDTMLGANAEDILTQWVATDLELNLAPGDSIVIFARDDENLMVNVGVFAGWRWK